MAVLLLDNETTGLDPTKDRAIELGARFVSNDFKDTICEVSSLMWESDYPPLLEEISRITNIHVEDIVKANKPRDVYMILNNQVKEFDIKVHAIIAYNMAFDGAFFDADMKRLFDLVPQGLADIMLAPKLCAMRDIEEHYKFKSWKQMHVALDWGITVNPKLLHRAINDVDLMQQILIESGTTIEKMYEYQKTPWVYVCALTQAPWEDGGVSTTEAKKNGYNWESARGDASARKFQKRWVKLIKVKDLEKEEKAISYKTRLIEEAV